MPRVAVGPWHLASIELAWLLGTGVQLQLAATAAAGAAWMALALFLAIAAGCLRHERRLAFAAVVVAAATLAFALADTRAQARLEERLPPELEGRDLLLTGVIVGLPRSSAMGTRFELRVESALLGEEPVRVPGRISLGWGKGWDGDPLLVMTPQPLVAGDRWRVPARLKQPHGLQNPHGFDLELWLFERGLRASGNVRPGARFLGTTWSQPVDRLRQRVRDAILLNVDDAPSAGVLAALAVGDQAAIDRDDWDVFRVTGVAHLMSISGLHVTMFAWLAAAGVGRIWRSMPRAMLAWPAPDAARWCGLLLALAYALIAGWGVPAQRTVLMLAVVTLLRSSGWRWPWLLVWLSAGTAVTALDPWALLQPGFWLSFAAVGLLMASDPGSDAHRRTGWRSWVAAGLRTQTVATAGLAPLSMVFFQQVSIVGAAANLLAVPWVTIVVAPTALAGALVQPLWQVSAWASQLLMAVLSWFASAPLAQWTAAAAPGWAATGGLLGGALLVLRLPWRLRWLGLPLMLPLLVPVPQRPLPGDVEILAADIGQGTAVLVRTHDHLLLYDAGPRYSPESDAAGRVLLPLLRARGDRAIDRLVLSHRDTDHIGGAQALLRGAHVEASLSSLEPGHPLLSLLPGHERCEAGQHWVWDGVSFEVLHPLASDYARGLAPNGLSCVIRVSDRHGPVLLLTGDIEAEQEVELLARSPPGALSARFLLLPHHGSRTSSTTDLLGAVAPAAAIAQAAYRSRYGHPAPEVVERVRLAGIQLVRSDGCGAWQWSGGAGADRGPDGEAKDEPQLGQAGLVVHCERERRRRYWHHAGVR